MLRQYTYLMIFLVVIVQFGLHMWCKEQLGQGDYWQADTPQTIPFKLGCKAQQRQS